MIEKLIGISLLFGLVAYLFFIPDWLRETIDWLFTKVFELIFDLIGFLEKLVEIATALLGFLGKLATLALLAGVLTIFLNEALPVFGFDKFLSGEQYVAWLMLFTEPYTWAAATTIVATTVAIGHIRKFDLDFEDFMEKQRERFQKRRDDRQARLRMTNDVNADTK